MRKNPAGKALRVFDSINRGLSWIPCILIAGIVLLTFVDVTGRYLLNRPLRGAFEITELAMVALGGFAILYTTTQRGHIVLDLFLSRYSRTTQVIVDVVGSLLGFAVWAILAYEAYVLAMYYNKVGQTSGMLGIGTGPFALALATGLFLHCLALLVRALRSLSSREEEGDSNI